jgi:hypothetical protein
MALELDKNTEVYEVGHSVFCFICRGYLMLSKVGGGSLYTVNWTELGRKWSWPVLSYVAGGIERNHKEPWSE